MFIDLHTHTNYSDGLMSINDITKWIKKKNIGVAITDHNAIEGAIQAHKKDKNRITLGIEVGASTGEHAVLLFYDLDNLKEFYENKIKNKIIKNTLTRWWETKLTPTEIIEYSEDYNYLTIAAHPYSRILVRKTWNFNKIENIKKLHALEILNSASPMFDNKKVEQIAKKLNKPGVAGSDAHLLENIGKAGIEIETNSNEETLNNIKKGKIQVKGRSFNTIERTRYVTKIAKNNALEYLSKNILKR